uniref:GK20370 n=1 Tax=Drosophila willistoni TaxID=7260 RepID=B4N577_DROWI
MSPNSRRYLMAFLVVLSFFVYRLMEAYLSFRFALGLAFLPRCTRHEVANNFPEDVIHQADSCVIEQQTSNGDEKQTLQYLKISCIAENLPQGRLKSHGQNILLHQRIPNPKSNKNQWNFRVPREAVNGLSLLLA